jgi:hypothetical protein
LMICCIERTSSSETDVLGKSENNGCSAVKVAFGNKGMDRDMVPQSTLPGEHLKVCSRGFTCCTLQMETKLVSLGKQDFNKTINNKIDQVRQNFIKLTAKYDAFCLELINKSSIDLHEMFLKTYGMLYQQNAKIFSDLFLDLRSYYRGRDLNLLDVLDNFFSTLMQRMFVLLNSQYTFDDKYLSCVTEKMDDLKPFGDVPQKLSTQVKRAFIAARTFFQGLAIGREAVIAISKIDLSPSCVDAVTKMSMCPLCRGLTQLKPCHTYCMNVMRGCLAYHYEINDAWNSYLEQLLKVAERLEGPFNIESIVDPIDVKISDAIMNFQENGENVNSKVFTGCGQPTLGSRSKRQSEDTSFGWAQDQRQPNNRLTTAAGTNIDRLIQEIKEKLSVTKDFWKELVPNVCSNMAANFSEETNCWNGQSKSRYTSPAVEDGLAYQSTNPEVSVDVRKSNVVINQQVLQLKLITMKLKNAYNGNDVDWIDNADSSDDESSGGSGQEESSGQNSGLGAFNPNEDISFSQSTHHRHVNVAFSTEAPYVKPTRPPSRPSVPTKSASPSLSFTRHLTVWSAWLLAALLLHRAPLS